MENVTIQNIPTQSKTQHLKISFDAEEGRVVYLNGVEGLRWGPGVWCVRVLIHGRWSGGEDRNLKAVKKGFRELLVKKRRTCICYGLLVWALVELG